MKTATEILTDATRSTLFGRFYEKIVSKWLEEVYGYKLARHPNGTVHKPRIYWSNILWDKFHFASVENFKPKPNELLKRSHCTPDGFFIRDGKSYVWEAKNWPLYPENGPEQQIWKYLSNNPWILATSANLSSSEKEISGFLFSFWNIPSITRARIEEQVNQIIGMGKFEIILTCDIIDDCIKEQYVWYRQIIEQEKENVGKFFIQLLGVE